MSQFHSNIPTKPANCLKKLSAKVPKLLKDLLGTLCSEEAGASIGKAAGVHLYGAENRN